MKGSASKVQNVALTLLSAMGVVHDVAAQSSTDGGQALEEIVVTAQKRAENLQDVPIAVSAFTGKELIDLGVNTAQGLQYITPGLVYSNSSAFAQPYLRGVGTRLAISGLEPSIATYVDDRYVSRPTAMMFELTDIERVEVLKGPQGTLFGRNATGGAIRLITKDVSDELEGSLTGSVGNHGYYGASGSVSIPVSDDFGVRLTGLTKQRDGFADNIFPRGESELDDQDFNAFRSKFRWKAADRFTARLLLDYWEREDTRGNDQTALNPVAFNTGVARGGIVGRDTDEVATAVDKKDQGDEFSAQLRLEFEFDPFDLVSISTYSDLHQTFTTDGDGTSTPVLDTVVFDTEEAYSQELQLISNGDGPWEWLLGAYLYNSDADFESTLNVGLPVYISPSHQAVETDAYAVFGNTKWNFSDQWAITLGARWSSEKKEVASRASTVVPLTVTPGLPFNDKDDWNEITPNVSLEYRLSSGLVYASYARGFKSGGFNYPAPGSRTLDPEILDMYELGFKLEFLDQRLRVNSSLYYYDYSDLQVTRSASATGALITENAADSEVLGLDLDVRWLATEHMTITTGLNVLDTEYKKFANANAKVFRAIVTGNPAIPGMVDALFDANGESMLRAPDVSAFVSLEYEFQLGEAALPVVLTYAYKDKYNFDFIANSFSEAFQQDSYGLLNGRASYIPSGAAWSVALWVNNATDEEYFDDVVGNAAGLRGSFGAPRTYGMDVTLHF